MDFVSSLVTSWQRLVTCLVLPFTQLQHVRARSKGAVWVHVCDFACCAHHNLTISVMRLLVGRGDAQPADASPYQDVVCQVAELPEGRGRMSRGQRNERPCRYCLPGPTRSHFS